MMILHLLNDIVNVLVPVKSAESYLLRHFIFLVLGNDHAEEWATVRELDLGFPNTCKDDLFHLDQLALFSEQQPQNQPMAILFLDLLEALDRRLSIDVVGVN